MNRLGTVLYGVAAAGIALFYARTSLDPAIWLFQEHPPRNAALGVAGLLLSTFGPIALSIWVWLRVRRLKARWLAHLFFIPAAILIFRQGASLFFYGAGVSGEGSPEGYSLFAAVALLLLTLLVHAAALIVEGYKRVARRAKGG